MRKLGITIDSAAKGCWAHRQWLDEHAQRGTTVEINGAPIDFIENTTYPDVLIDNAALKLIEATWHTGPGNDPSHKRQV